MAEQTAGTMSVVVAPILNCGESSLWVIKKAVAEAVARAVKALRLPAEGPPSVDVSIGPVDEGPYSVTAGGMTFSGQPAALSASAGLTTVADTIAATICTERSILCAVTGLDDPGLQRLVRIGAAVPSAALQAGGVDRACEEVLAARTGPVLSVTVAADLAESAEHVLPAELDAVRGEFFTYWGVPVPVIQVQASPAQRAGLTQVTLLDTPFVSATPSGTDDRRPAVDAIRDTVRNIAASNIPSLLTARAVDLLLGALARTDPRLVGVLRDRYDRVDITGVFRVLLTYQIPLKNLRPILDRLAGLQGGLNPGQSQAVVMPPTSRYFVGDPGATPGYVALANAAGPFAWQYTLKRTHAERLAQRIAAPTASGGT